MYYITCPTKLGQENQCIGIDFLKYDIVCPKINFHKARFSFKNLIGEKKYSIPIG